MFRSLLAILAGAACVAVPAHAHDRNLPRAVVVDIVNATRDRHAAVLPAATDALAVALSRAGVYDIVSRKELDRAALERRLRPPYAASDLSALAKDLGATAVITGELRFIDIVGRAPNREVGVGILVRVRDAATGELINGAAERGAAPYPDDGSKSDYAVLMDAAIAGAERCAARIAEYRPITGTVLNNQDNDVVVINRGIGDGVKKGQEFVAYRGGVAVARLRMFKPFGQYTLLKITEATMGVQPQDRVVSVFPEPKFGKSAAR